MPNDKFQTAHGASWFCRSALSQLAAGSQLRCCLEKSFPLDLFRATQTCLHTVGSNVNFFFRAGRQQTLLLRPPPASLTGLNVMLLEGKHSRLTAALRCALMHKCFSTLRQSWKRKEHKLKAHLATFTAIYWQGIQKCADIYWHEITAHTLQVVLILYCTCIYICTYHQLICPYLPFYQPLDAPKTSYPGTLSWLQDATDWRSLFCAGESWQRHSSCFSASRCLEMTEPAGLLTPLSSHLSPGPVPVLWETLCPPLCLALAPSWCLPSQQREQWQLQMNREMMGWGKNRKLRLSCNI